MVTSGRPAKVLWTACQQAAIHAGLQDKNIHPHTLRHCFATHLLEAGADLRTSRFCSGIVTLEETTIYLHLSQKHLSATSSPLDQLALASRRSAPRNATTPRRDGRYIRYAGAGFVERSHRWINGQHLKVLQAILRCRTAGTRRPSRSVRGLRAYCHFHNSCRNRHCPNARATHA